MANSPSLRPQYNLSFKYLKKIMSEEEFNKLVDKYVEEKMKESELRKKGICPRCGKMNMVKPVYHNALSRKTRDVNSDKIWVCSMCGTDEALIEYFKHEEKEWVYPTGDVSKS